MNQPRMYHDLASLWPVISPPENYREVAVQFVTLIRSYGPANPRTVLHFGCGGGHLDFTSEALFSGDRSEYE